MSRKLFADRFRILISDRIDRHKRLHMTSRAPELNMALGNLTFRPRRHLAVLTQMILATQDFALFENNISPKLSYSNGQIVALHVPLYKQHIYKTPMYASSLLRWSDELSRIGYHVPYLGEGLASFTHNVVLALVKTKGKRYHEPKDLVYWKKTTIVVLYAVTKGMRSVISWNWTIQCRYETVGTTYKISCRCVRLVTLTYRIWNR